jgi:hypothetical protein
MKRHFAELPDWEFDVQEVSAGVYEVIGKSKFGPNTSAKGFDVDELVDQCKKYAISFSSKS